MDVVERSLLLLSLEGMAEFVEALILSMENFGAKVALIVNDLTSQGLGHLNPFILKKNLCCPTCLAYQLLVCFHCLFVQIFL